MTDDQSVGQYTSLAMPKTRRFFADGGSNLTQAIAAPPLCCPSRAGFLTGQYNHDNGVLGNDPGYGALRDKDNTLPVWMQEAGYRTGMIGKFLNEYESVGGSEPAPGFERWFALYGFAGYFGTEVSDDGARSHLPDDRYTTDELTDQARSFIADDDPRPFFLWLSYNAPHTLPDVSGPCRGTSAVPKDAETLARFDGERGPRNGAYDEADVSDKPPWMQRNPLNRVEVKAADRRWRCALSSLSTVDDDFAEVTAELRASGELGNTIVIFLSDNGYFYGEHRLEVDKRLAYEDALRVPMAVRVPGRLRDGDAPASIGELISNSDVAPTVLDYARARPCTADGRCRRLDGRSIRGLLSGDDGEWPADRGVPFQLDDGFVYRALRTPDYLYVEATADRHGEFDSPTRELYDLGADPDELENLAAPGADSSPGTDELLDRFAERLDRASECSGASGRDEALADRPLCD